MTGQPIKDEDYLYRFEMYTVAEKEQSQPVAGNIRRRRTTVGQTAELYVRPFGVLLRRNGGSWEDIRL